MKMKCSSAVRPEDGVGQGGEQTPQEKYRLKFYETCGLFSFMFVDWSRSWMKYLCDESVGIDELHPLPRADDISYWQPIFSKHVSDGLLRLEEADYGLSSPDNTRKASKACGNIIVRALLLTFWKRCLILVVAQLIMQMISVGTSLLLKYLVGLMASPDRSLNGIIGMILVIVGVDFVGGVLNQHLFMYFQRVHITMQSVLTVTLFQHGMSHRRAYSSAIGDCPLTGKCKGVVHSWPCKDDGCSSNPLECPARRHQNKELPPSMYVFMFVDVYAIVCIINAMVDITKFLCTFIMSMMIISSNIGMNVLIPASIVVTLVLSMVVIEVINGYVWFHNLQSKDESVARTAEAVGNLKVLKVMGMEDIGYNIVQHSRQDEMMIIKTRTGLHSTSVYLNNILGVSVLLFVLLDYIKSMKKSDDISFDISAPITVMFIVEKITEASATLPQTMKTVVEAATSVRRVERFLRSCSPNFYLSCRSDSKHKVQHDFPKLGNGCEGISNETVVQYKGATFTWINSREEVLDCTGRKSPVLRGVDFELKRGDVKIITGNQGCGKSSFLKSILGEMSLVSGSMAVAPLCTGMPIFYTSQEVWLPSGSIRSIITFGYAYDEDIYKEVVRCAELESDFNSWENGDCRVISEKGYSLSGGQRVRISLARALYAYMIFSKANEDMEENRCCFLVCLDEPFNGLDVTVATSIFNNLFHKENGLLIRDDVAVVMAMSGTTMDIAIGSWAVWDVVDMTFCTIDRGVISESQSLRKAFKIDDEAGMANGGTNSYTRRCSSFNKFSCYQMVEPLTPVGHIATSSSSYNQVLRDPSQPSIKDGTDISSTWGAYILYVKAVGYFLFCVLALCMILPNVSANLMLVSCSKLADSVKLFMESSEVHGKSTSEIMKQYLQYYRWITIFAFGTPISAIWLAGILLVTSLRSARRVHNFVINSVFHKSATDITIKSSIGALITFITSDIYIIGELIGSGLYETAYSFLQFLAKMVALDYLMPMAIPVPLLTFGLLYHFLHKKYLRSAKILQQLMLQSNCTINRVYNDVITGSAIYRSFRKEHQWMNDIRTCSDGYYRTKFLQAAGSAWVSMVSKFFTAIMIAVFTLIPVVQSRIVGRDLEVAKLGIAISLCVSLGNCIKSFVNNYSELEREMCSMVRFEKYFANRRSSLGEQFESMNETMLSGFYTQEQVSREQDRKVRDSLLIRRKKEFHAFAFRRYRSVLDTLFYRPYIEVLYLADYLPLKCSVIELKDVSLKSPSTFDVPGKTYILNRLSAKAYAGDVIGIVGRTGAGKSSLLNVIQYSVPHCEGYVLLDGVEVSKIPRSLRRHVIGVLPQIPFILKGWTLRRFLDPRMMYSDGEIFNALECCGLINMVNSFPGGKGLDTLLLSEDVVASRNFFVTTPLIRLNSSVDRVGKQEMIDAYGDQTKEGGDEELLLSATQLRQLWFAKLVLYRHSYRVLLIDEPPSNNCLRQQYSRSVRVSFIPEVGLPIYDIVKLYFTHCITFIVAHDKNALRSCTRLWVMEKGRLTKECSAEHFLQNGLTESNSGCFD